MKVPVADAAVVVDEGLLPRVVDKVVEDDFCEDEVELLLCLGQSPGRHCEYQSLEYVQQVPGTHDVGPVQPKPPPRIKINDDLWSDEDIRISYIGPIQSAGQAHLEAR